jgi:hypothetical protein
MAIDNIVVFIFIREFKISVFSILFFILTNGKNNIKQVVIIGILNTKYEPNVNINE